MLRIRNVPPACTTNACVLLHSMVRLAAELSIVRSCASTMTGSLKTKLEPPGAKSFTTLFVATAALISATEPMGRKPPGSRGGGDGE
eukprot:5273471-Prymnesium_polylepis.1